MGEGAAADQVREADLRGAPQRGADVAAQRARIDVDLLEEGSGIALVIAARGPDGVAVDARLADGGVQRPLHRQPDFGRRGVELHREIDLGLVTEAERAGLDAPQQVDHPPVLEPHLVVEEPSQLLGQLPHRRLGGLGGLQPVMVHVPQPGVAVGVAGELVDPVEQIRQLLLPRPRQQEVVERLERPALIGPGDRLPAAEDVVEQFSLAALPARDPLPQLPVELAEVLLDLAEVGEQLPCGRGELLVAVADAALVEHGRLARLDAGDLVLKRALLAPQLLDLGHRIRLGAEDDLAEQVEDRVQPGLRADEVALLQAAHPLQRPLHRRGRVEVRLVTALGVVLAQPARLRRGPVVQVRPGGLGKAVRCPLIARVELVIEAAGQLGGRDGADVLLDEDPVQEAQHERRVVRAQQPPRRAVGAQPGDLFEVHAPCHAAHRRGEA